LADRIGVQRKWFQRYASAPHYDIGEAKRALAVAAGAIKLTERREFAAIIRVSAKILIEAAEEAFLGAVSEPLVCPAKRVYLAMQARTQTSRHLARGQIRLRRAKRRDTNEIR
jgi:hypothetical protein